MKKCVCPINVLFIIFCGILVSWVILHNCKKPVKTNTVKLQESSYFSDCLYIPVTINERIYPFVFDTGSSVNVIDSGFAQKIGFSPDGDFFKSLKRFSNQIRQDTISYSNQKISIGNFQFNEVFFLNGYKGLVVDDIEYMKKYKAIMGMETIGQLNWLFNFSDNTVTFSKDIITIPTLPDEQILTLDFYTKNGITCMNLTMDGILIRNVGFDTGYDNTNVQFGNKFESFDIVFSKSDMETLTSNNKMSNALIFPAVIENFGNAYFLDSMKINDYKMQGIFAFVNNDYDQTLITVNFVRRFRMMYFDSLNKKIHLYVSPSDSVRSQKKELQIYRRRLIQLKKESNGNAFEIPSSLIDSIWSN